MTAGGRILAVILEEADEATMQALADRLAPFLPAPPIDSDGWLDAKGAAAYLGMSINALHKLTAARDPAGRIPFHQDTPKGKLWFRRSELDAWRTGASPGPGSARRSPLPCIR